MSRRKPKGKYTVWVETHTTKFLYIVKYRDETVAGFSKISAARRYANDMNFRMDLKAIILGGPSNEKN